uniref:Mitochondrial transcription rescue factor 1 C-terminal domain-containing protein n=1 Tax=Strigamia maritima TaxID=126957 RepID=T1IP42_STRMM
MAAPLVKCCRTLYSPRALKTDQYAQMRAEKEVISKKVDVNFRDRMKFNLKSSQNKVIFADEVIKMMYLIRKNDPDDMELLINMLKNICNQETKPTDIKIGNLLMCMFHWLDEPELAFDVLKNPEFEYIFIKSNSYLVLMDLYFERKEYGRVLDILKLCRSRGKSFPYDICVLALASCYKMPGYLCKNKMLTQKESFDFTKNLIESAKEHKVDLLRRGLTFASALAIKQNEPEYALELLSFVEEDKFFTVSNLKMMALADLGRLEEIFQLLHAILGHNSPEIRHVRYYKQLYPDTYIKIKTAIEEKSECKGVEMSDLMKIYSKLNIQKKISRHSLDDELLKLITRKAEEPTGLRSREIYKSKDLFEDDANLVAPCNQVIFSRFKGSNRGKGFTDDEEIGSKWDEVELDSEVGSDFKDVTTHAASSRLDKILKVGLGLSNSKIETAFYDSRLRLNGEKVLKKSIPLNLGDEVDLIIGANSGNDKFVDIMKVILRGIKEEPGKEKVQVKLRRFKLLTIENYPFTNAYKSSTKVDKE